MRSINLLHVVWVVAHGCLAATGELFQRPQFGDGMILQRGNGTLIFGYKAVAPVKVVVTTANTQYVATSAAPDPSNDGRWIASLPAMVAQITSTITATDGKTTDTINDVAFGDVLLCGGQSNMGFGMCGATVISTGREHPPQTPSAALSTLPAKNPIRFFWQSGDRNGGAGSTVKGNICRATETTSTPQNMTWFNALPSNAGAASAVCLMTAQNLRASLGGNIPVGAVESCVGGTPVTLWTPPSGSLYVQHIKPLLPMTFAAALWDQGERDAKTTNTTYYSTEFPKMIQGWRSNFKTPALPFVYVELCHELGAEQPKEPDFWEDGQRAALKLPFVGFATTTDVDKSALHPPDKQDIAPRLNLELQRLVYGKDVVARGPELVSTAFDETTSELTITLSNSSLVITDGVVVPAPSSGCSSQTSSPAVTQVGSAPPAFRIAGDTVVVKCKPGGPSSPVLINGDASTCFLYSRDSGLPAPPLALPCA